ncbi:MAG: hypothetical protein AB4058_10785 [Microcystaceae cyanobacterium]
MKPKFILDENLSKKIKFAVLNINKNINIVCVGDPDTPSLGTLDPEILDYLEVSQRILVTDNRKSMPKHLQDHWQNNQEIWGLFWVREKTSIGELAESICLIWEISEANEWLNVVDWIPF